MDHRYGCEDDEIVIRNEDVVRTSYVQIVFSNIKVERTQGSVGLGRCSYHNRCRLDATPLSSVERMLITL